MRAFQAQRPNASFDASLGQIVALFSDLRWRQFDSLDDDGVVEALWAQTERDGSYIVAMYSLVPHIWGFTVFSREDDAPCRLDE